MQKKTESIFVFVLTAFSILTSACASAPSPTANSKPENKFEERVAGKPGGTLTYRFSAPPKTFNYLMAADEPSIVTTLYLLSSRPIEFDHRSQKYVAALAETWTTADGQTVDIKLRDGLKFSDGRALTSDDVIFSLKAIYDEKTDSPAFRDAMLINGKQIEARRIDDVRLQMIFPEKVAAVENYLDNLGVLPKHILEPELNAGKLAEAWKITADPATIATSGAFTLESSTPGERVTLKKNPHYFKKDENGVALPYLDKFILQIIPDSNNAFAALGQGSLDMVDRIRGTDFAALTSDQTGPVRAFDLGPGLGTDHIWFNMNRSMADGKRLDNTPKFKWFSNKAFRQAISSAIDRNTISTITLKGLATPLYGFVSPANRVWINPDLPKPPYDIEKSKSQLKAAGFVLKGTSAAPELFDAENNRIEFSLLVPAENEQRKLIAAVVQEDLAKVGIKMQVVPIENQGIAERWSKTFDYDAMLFGLSVTGIEPTSYANFVLSGSSVHQWQPNQKTPATEWEAKVDKLFVEQARETDAAKRAVIFNEIQSILADESPVIPITARHIVTAANTRIGNYAPSGIFPYSIWNASELFVK